MEPEVRVVVDPGTDWVVFSTALGAILISSIAVYLNGRRTRLQLGITNMWRQIDTWDSPEMRTLRSRLGERLLNHPEERHRISDDGIDLLNTFELLGYLVVKSRTLRMRDAWANFSLWAVSWWYVYERGIQQLRREKADDLTIYEDYEELVIEFIAHDVKRRKLPREQVIPLEEDLEGFLRAESRLLKRELEEIAAEFREAASEAGQDRPSGEA